jgi:coenzyme F420-reducing hydrogenase beta subunit
MCVCQVRSVDKLEAAVAKRSAEVVALERKLMDARTALAIAEATLQNGGAVSQLATTCALHGLD